MVSPSWEDVCGDIPNGAQHQPQETSMAFAKRLPSSLVTHNLATWTKLAKPKKKPLESSGGFLYFYICC